ncbi:multidrug effflux MFS transporter [Chondrinema litorale]|uniref:multidrug effflux MFS transporter n=1 Tax=Chondrinema litorale TaxID=2994555 RepID=UPI00254317E4|nr:multidrug effflux MFS transporter [Chondrinema litorale]UZR96916.1 multidrug effflux MFS transporter [Chondrinema litorale]
MSFNKKDSNFLLIFILGLLTAIGPLATDMYLPAFEEIAAKFNTDISKVSLSLSSFFIGLSIGQLIYGPLLERYGRKKPMYVGVAIYIVASIGCAVSTNVNELIVYRFFQAIGACGGLVAARAVVKDLFDTKEVARVFSMLMMVVAVSPILAPTLGGFISTTFHWKYIFIMMVFLAIVILFGAYYLMPESKKPDPDYSLKLGSIIKNYIAVLKNPQFIIFAMTGAIAYAGVYAYLSGSPHLYLEVFNVTQGQYSLIFGIIAAGLIGSNQVNRFLLKKHSSENTIYKASIVQCIVAVVLVTFYFLEFKGLYITTFLIFSYMSCLGFIFPNASALSLNNLGNTAGNASAMLGSLQMVMGAIASALVSVFQTEDSLPMIMIMSICAGVALLVLNLGNKKLAQQKQVEFY